MKTTNFILSALFLLLSLGELWAQQQKPYRPAATFKGDTLAYLEYNYYKRQAQYRGKAVEVVLKELEYPVIYVAGTYRDGSPSQLIRLTLGIRQEGKESSGWSDYYIIIGFANPPDGEEYREASGSSMDNSSPAFSQKLYDFLKDLKISKISSNKNILKDRELIEEQRREWERYWQDLERQKREIERKKRDLERNNRNSE